MVEVADVDAELERGGGHDRAVGRFGEGLLGLPSFVDAERAVGHEGGHVVGAEQRSQLLGPGPAVDEHETASAPCAGVRAQRRWRANRRSPEHHLCLWPG
ncbi:MAG: hypothetical protein R2694_16095 [Ilumatobacteraceae bacterium]